MSSPHLPVTQRLLMVPRNGTAPLTQGDELLCFPAPGDVLEQAVFLSVRLQDEAAFERNYLQLKTYYTDTRRGLPDT